MKGLGLRRANHKMEALGSFPFLMQVTPRKEPIDAATIFWDETKSIFKFGHIEMTPLLEETEGGYVEDMNLLPKKIWQTTEVIILKSVTLEEVRDK